MQKFKVLVLTDHRGHSAENSIYALLRAMSEHPSNGGLDVASRGNGQNAPFFTEFADHTLYVSPVDERLAFSRNGRWFTQSLRRARPRDYDFILLRLPPPIAPDFWAFLLQAFPERRIINNPRGILETSNKKFLLQFPDLCPPMRSCRTVEEIAAFRENFPIVLKPLNNYGGKGIVRIDGDTVWDGLEKKSFLKFTGELERQSGFEYLAMKYLVNVSQGDKRIIVCREEVLGATLRKPAEGSWLCNAAQGGQPHGAELTTEERRIVERLKGEMTRRGIVMYGIDTLVDDDGQRVLSEINTLSIGGIQQMELLNKEPVVARTADLLWQYIKEEINGKPNSTAR